MHKILLSYVSPGASFCAAKSAQYLELDALVWDNFGRWAALADAQVVAKGILFARETIRYPQRNAFDVTLRITRRAVNRITFACQWRTINDIKLARRSDSTACSRRCAAPDVIAP